jgi:hypothetical protein
VRVSSSTHVRALKRVHSQRFVSAVDSQMFPPKSSLSRKHASLLPSTTTIHSSVSSHPRRMNYTPCSKKNPTRKQTIVHVLSAKTRGCCRDRDPHPHPSDRSKSDRPVRPFARQKGTRAISHKVTCKCSRACILCPPKIHYSPPLNAHDLSLPPKNASSKTREAFFWPSSSGRDTSVAFWGERIFHDAVSSGWSS